GEAAHDADPCRRDDRALGPASGALRPADRGGPGGARPRHPAAVRTPVPEHLYLVPVGFGSGAVLQIRQELHVSLPAFLGGQPGEPHRGGARAHPHHPDSRTALPAESLSLARGRPYSPPLWGAHGTGARIAGEADPGAARRAARAARGDRARGHPAKDTRLARRAPLSAARAHRIRAHDSRPLDGAHPTPDAGRRDRPERLRQLTGGAGGKTWPFRLRVPPENCTWVVT